MKGKGGDVVLAVSEWKGTQVDWKDEMDEDEMDQIDAEIKTVEKWTWIFNRMREIELEREPGGYTLETFESAIELVQKSTWVFTRALGWRVLESRGGK